MLCWLIWDLVVTEPRDVDEGRRGNPGSRGPDSSDGHVTAAAIGN